MDGKISKFVVLIPLAAYFIFALLHLSLPGINSDEILFGNAAVGMVNKDSHIYITYKDAPVLLMPYIGALKSYLYYPIFKLFGVSVWSIRLPMILLSGLTVFLVYRIMLISNKSVLIAFLAALFLATHASFVTYTRTDQGPLAIELFLKTLAIWLFLRFIESKNPRFLIWIPLVMFLGVFNKLNFIWTLNAFILGILVFYKDILAVIYKGSSKERFTMIFYPLLTVAICFGFYFYLSTRLAMLNSFFPKEITLDFIKERLSSIHDLSQSNFRGTLFLSYMYEKLPTFEKISYAPFLPSTVLNHMTLKNFNVCLLLILAGTLVNLYHFFIRNDDSRKFSLFFVLILAGLTAQIIMVTNATAGWHLFTAYPMLVLAIFSALATLFKNTALRIILFVPLLAGNVNDYAHNISAYLHLKPYNIWSTSINDLIDYTKKTDAPFYQLTWGTDDQLVTFNQEKDKYFKTYQTEDVAPGEEIFANTPEARTNLYKNYILGKYQQGFYIVSWQKNLWFRNFYIFEQTLKDHHLTYEVVKNFYDRGEPTYSILKVKEK